MLFGRGAGVHQGLRPRLAEHDGHLRDRFGFLSPEPIRGPDGADPDRCGWSSWLCSVLRRTDDFLMLVRSGAVSRPLLMAILLVRALSIPLKWSKFRGGVPTEWVGYFTGVSDRRCDLAARWCRTQAQGKIEVASFREGLGRLAFAAGPLRRPFLGPLYAWCAAVGGQHSADLPPLVVLVLELLAEEFDEKRRTSYVPSTKALGEMFRSDAKAAEGQKVVVGGWELAGSERGCDARWFALELSSAEIPWAYERGDPFKAISALELLATLLLVVFGVPGRGASRGTVSLETTAPTGLLWTNSPPPSIRWAWC